MEALLNVENVSKRFGGINALSSLSFRVGDNEILGVIGPNGSGKSTLINLISGVYRPSEGRIMFNGKSLTNLKTWEITRLGVVRTFQIPSVFRDFTVLENVVFPLCFTANLNLAKSLEQARSVLTEHGLDGGKKASELTLYEERKVELLRALLLKPKLLMIDEALSGLTAQEAGEICDLIVRSSSEMKFSVIWVEHRVKELTKHVRRMMVLNYGTKLAEGSPEEVVRTKEVIEAYIGGEAVF
ncbi:MAG: ATP-binding cassette domain-containing protein [Candidatus Caldarchaeum sp.]|nr:ATP-binding cassette domain-containing protein [Candidatus Caldarchaeum sp.]MDW7977564.1 ATP-binding cassette domain-containing protein [Candidatus Caldarchaeum sp.]